MPTIELFEELAFALTSAAREEPQPPSREVAELFYRDHPELVDHFGKEWMLSEIARLIRVRRRQLQADEDPQMVLGFRPPKEIAWAKDRVVPFGDATLNKLLLHRKMLSERWKSYKHPSVVRIDKAIELMKQYVPKQHGITWNRVAELEAAKKRQAAEQSSPG